jgi:RHS repeat-associated protein
MTTQGATYNGAGDLTGGAGFSSLTYDDAGQTTSVTPSGGTAATLSYVDYDQNQLYSAGGTTIEPTAIGIAATITNGLTTGYAYTPAGGLLAENTNGSTYYYLLDPHGGSILGLTDSSGNLADNYTYSPYGQQTAVQSTAPNLFGYNGGLQAPGTSLIHFGARWYNPALGQWTQQDPSGQDPGYVYAGDSPVNYADPTGQDLWSTIGDAIASGVDSLDLLSSANDITNEIFAGDLQEQLAILGGVATGVAVEGVCNLALGAADVPTAGLATVAGEFGCTAAAYAASSTVENEINGGS